MKPPETVLNTMLRVAKCTHLLQVFSPKPLLARLRTNIFLLETCFCDDPLALAMSCSLPPRLEKPDDAILGAAPETASGRPAGKPTHCWKTDLEALTQQAACKKCRPSRQPTAVTGASCTWTSCNLPAAAHVRIAFEQMTFLLRRVKSVRRTDTRRGL